MKKYLKGVTIPFIYFDTYSSYVIYKDKKYSFIEDAIFDFLHVTLNYHLEIDGEIITVHSLEKVIEQIVIYKGKVIIDKYKDEYSSIEYRFICGLIDSFRKDQLHYLPYEKFRLRKYDIFHLKYLLFRLEISRYKNKFPKKIYSKILKRHIWVYSGRFSYSISDAITEFYYDSFYYQFAGNGCGDETKDHHVHEHEIKYILTYIINHFDAFKIYDYQKEFYSKQELEFMNQFLLKLKSMNYHSYIDHTQKYTYEEYKDLKNHKRYFKLLFFNIGEYFYMKKIRREKIKAYKI